MTKKPGLFRLQQGKLGFKKRKNRMSQCNKYILC
jgi:hypothetical protein